jgi:hypothetical protein
MVCYQQWASDIPGDRLLQTEKMTFFGINNKVPHTGLEFQVPAAPLGIILAAA